MKLLTQYFFTFLILSFITSPLIYSQQISDVSFDMVGDDIQITYTLTAPAEEEYEISTVLKRLNDPSFSYVPENLSEDIGDDQYAGVNKKIIWDVSEEEFNMFDGDDFYFEVNAERIPESGGIPWYYFVGTAAVGGAVAAAVLLGGDDNGGGGSTPSTNNFPNPPSRP